MVRQISIIAIGLTASVAWSQQISVNLDRAGDTWSYTLTNTNTSNQTPWLTSFYLPIHAPVSNISVENNLRNWSFESDLLSYIRWFNPEPGPSLNDVEPGGSITFLFDSEATEETELISFATSYDHLTDMIGPTIEANTVAPVPEPASIVVVGLGVAALLRRRR